MNRQRGISKRGAPALIQPPVIGGRDAIDGFEQAGEVKGIVVTEFRSHLLDAKICRFEDIARALDFEPDKEVFRGESGAFFKYGKKMRGGKICQAGERGDLQRLAQKLLHIPNGESDPVISSVRPIHGREPRD